MYQLYFWASLFMGLERLHTPYLFRRKRWSWQSVVCFLQLQIVLVWQYETTEEGWREKSNKNENARHVKDDGNSEVLLFILLMVAPCDKLVEPCQGLVVVQAHRLAPPPSVTPLHSTADELAPQQPNIGFSPECSSGSNRICTYAVKLLFLLH